MNDSSHSCVPSAKKLVSLAQNLRVNAADYSVPEGYKLECLTSADLRTGCIDWMLKSIYDSLRSLYEDSAIGWNGDEKRGELEDSRQRYLLLSTSSRPVAFVSYMYDVEDSFAALYVYELFVERSERRKGLAVILMNIAERLGRRANMQKIMLTMFTGNKAAMKLYLSTLQYEIDSNSPSRFREENEEDDVGYEILSKTLIRAQQTS